MTVRERAVQAPQPVLLIPGVDARELVLTFAGNVVKHLGVQMYAGRPVPAIAELISNAWDADATSVDVHLPLDQAWEPSNQEHVIEVSDRGTGMTWEMIRDSYLDVGRDRREVEMTDRSSGGRPLQGRKGVGKLAGFGIADIVEVQTVNKDPDPRFGERLLIWFRLSLDELKKAQRSPAPVELFYAGPVSKAPSGGRKEVGTTVTLRRLHERRAQNGDRFRRSMAQRFLLIGPQFKVTINDAELSEEEVVLQWRWPQTGWNEDEVPGCGPVQYWIGFSEHPRKQDEGDLSGLLLYTRGKVSQEATFFDVSGGVTGQHGLRYMVGKVRAEWLDGGVAEPDLIATHRGSIAWESPQGQALQAWGQKLVKRYLVEWARLRAELRQAAVTELSPEIKARIEGLAPVYQEAATDFVQKFKKVEMEVKEFEDLLSTFLSALENATLRRVIEKLRDTEETDLAKLDDLLSRMHVRTAVGLLQIIESNLAAIETLEKMHLENARERGVISKHLEKNPWLIHPTWILNKAEGRVSTWIQTEFGLAPKGDEHDEERSDFFCVGVGGTLHIVEIKRGAHVAKALDILQADKYRTYVLDRFTQISDPEAIKYGHVQSHLVAAELDPAAVNIKNAYQDKGWVTFTIWSDLIERAKVSHHQFQEELKRTAGQLDPPEV